jgi:hypothetical protein
VRNELRAELGKDEKPSDKKKIHTKEELRAYARQLEQKYYDREISHAEYVAYKEQLDDLNEERIREDFKRENTREFSRARAEENVNNWATQNSPDLLDKRTKASRDAVAFGTQYLGAELADGVWTLPESVGRVLFSLASGAQEQTEREQAAENRGREKALRDRDLRDGGKPPGSKDSSDKKKVKKGLSEVERDVKERLGLSPNAMKFYKRIKGKRDVEVNH